MGLLSFARKRRDTVRGRGYSERPSKHPGGPKNGPLTLAVAGTIALMVALSLLNYRLIRDHSVGGKTAAIRHASGKRAIPPASSAKRSDSERAPSSYVPPKVTFYRQLTQSDVDPTGQPPIEVGTETEHESQASSQTSSPNSLQSENPRQADRFSCAATAPASSQPRADLPNVGKGPVMYTVQVGAFTDPAVAQQWAQKWKARGYKVTLKPVARPHSGISYRLYLGKFSSQKKADDLVRRLKRNEGISALRLLVRN